MGKYKCIIFDLDGTIADTKKGIINGFCYAANEMGFKYLKEYESDIIGPSLYYSFSKFYGLSEQDSNEAVNLYRKYYRQKGLYEFVLYEGIKKLLSDLKRKNISVALATTKYKDFAELMIKKSGIYDCFDFIAGSNEDGTLSDKKDLLTHVMLKTGYEAFDCIMTGDRLYDAKGAEQVKMDFIWAQYGYGKKEEFEGIKIDYTVNCVPDFYDIVIN